MIKILQLLVHDCYRLTYIMEVLRYVRVFNSTWAKLLPAMFALSFTWHFIVISLSLIDSSTDYSSLVYTWMITDHTQFREHWHRVLPENLRHWPSYFCSEKVWISQYCNFHTTNSVNNHLDDINPRKSLTWGSFHLRNPSHMTWTPHQHNIQQLITNQTNCHFSLLKLSWNFFLLQLLFCQSSVIKHL